MASVEKLPMLIDGHRKLQDDLKRLKAECPEVIDAIEEARAHGDLSENAEYHAAKERQGWIEGQIAEIEDKISRAQVIDVSKLSGSQVKFGATVTVVGASWGDGPGKVEQWELLARARALETCSTTPAVRRDR